jgi:hypothetical protein
MDRTRALGVINRTRGLTGPNDASEERQPSGWATLKLHHRQDLDACRVLINQIVAVQPDLKDHKLVKALRGDDE